VGIYGMTRRVSYPLWKVMPQFAQFLLDHREDLDDHQDEMRHLAYWIVQGFLLVLKVPKK
jgi:hypothetical protein